MAIMTELEIRDELKKLANLVLDATANVALLKAAMDALIKIDAHEDAIDAALDEENETATDRFFAEPDWDGDALASAGWGTDEDYFSGERL